MSTVHVFRGLLGLLVLLSLPEYSFFSGMYQTVDLSIPNVPAFCLIGVCRLSALYLKWAPALALTPPWSSCPDFFRPDTTFNLISDLWKVV